MAQLVDLKVQPAAATNSVDDYPASASPFGATLLWSDHPQLVARLECARTPFSIESYVGFAGRLGEQITLFARDRSGNV